MDNNDQLIQEQLKSVPQEVQEAISKVPWKDRVKDIAKREGLDAEKSQALETETLLIIYGFLPANEYGANINSELGLNDEATGRIVKLVSDEIFADIEKQVEMLEAKNTTSQATPPQTPTPSPAPASQMPAERVVPITTQTSPAPTSEASATPTPPKPPRVFEVQTNLPEIMPNQPAHNVTPLQTAQSTPPVLKPNLVPTPTYGTPQQASNEASSQRPELNLPKSDYNHGQDPYREPLQ
jgi:hypothetical protein